MSDYDFFTKRLRFKFFILNEITLGIKLSKHLYKIIIAKKHDELYWIVKINGRLIYKTPLKPSSNFYDILLKITEHEKEL